MVENNSVLEAQERTEEYSHKIIPFVRPGQEENEIDLLDLADMLLDKVHYLIVSVLLGALLLNAYAFFCITPTYQSTAKMYVLSASKDSLVDLADLSIGISLTSDYEELIYSYPVLDRVIAELDLGLETEQLKGMIALENPENTRILNVTVTSTDPQLSVDIANKVTEVAVEYLPETMSTNPPNIAQQARLPKGKVGPSYFKYTMMGALLGLLLCGGFFTYRYLIDDAVRNSEDIEKYFGVVPLTVIPESEELEQMTKRNKKTRKGQ